MHILYSSGPSLTSSGLSTDSLTAFALAHQNNQTINIIHTAWSQIICSIDPSNDSDKTTRESPGRLLCLGTPPHLLHDKLEHRATTIANNEVVSAAGDHNGVQVIVLKTGTVCSVRIPAFPRDSSTTHTLTAVQSTPDSTTVSEIPILVPIYIPGTPPLSLHQKITAIAITNAGRVAVALASPQTKLARSSEILEFATLGESTPSSPSATLSHVISAGSEDSFCAWLRGAEHVTPLSRHGVAGIVTCLRATMYSFAALTDRGDVYTWAADGRYTVLADLGRDAGAAREPGLVGCTAGLRVVRVVACQGDKWVGAVTEAGDGYVWGAGIERCEGLGEDVEGGVMRVVLPFDREGRDEEDALETEVVSMAVGVKHLVALDSDGRVWVWAGRRWEQACGASGTAVAVDASDGGCFIVTRQ